MQKLKYLIFLGLPVLLSMYTLKAHADLQTSLNEVVKGLEEKHSQPLGICLKISIPGSKKIVIYQSGKWQQGYAWSTIKVPVAIAALLKNDSSENRELACSSICQSDNFASFKLLNSLQPETVGGLRPVAMQSVETIIRAAGDQKTMMDQEYSGLTLWSLEDAATFMLGLQNFDHDAARFVRDLMMNIDSKHCFGLGQIHGMMFKTGWGEVLAEGSDDNYTGYDCRQMGYLALSNGGGISIAIGTTSNIDRFSLEGHEAPSDEDEFDKSSAFYPSFSKGREVLSDFTSKIFLLLKKEMNL
ncbi:MAG: hypothetical protein LBT69_04645 [Lactobacillales bacterium]|nr:hypothetical protein [Lactobacillales bacterium]